MRKPVDKEYLLQTLKAFDSQVLKDEYTKNSDIDILKNHIQEEIEKISSKVGKNVQVGKIEPIIGGNRITFVYYDDSDIQKISSMEVMNGEQGVSIVNANVTDENFLVLELSNGQTITAGQITVDSSKLTLDDYYTIEQTDEKFVQKLELNTLIQNYMDSTFQPIEFEEIKNLF